MRLELCLDKEGRTHHDTLQAVMDGLGDVGDVAEEVFEGLGQPYLTPAEKSLLLQYRMNRRHAHTPSTLSSPGIRYHSDHHPEPSTPPLLSSPSAASLSSHGALSASVAALSPVKGAGLLQSALPLEVPGFPPSHGRVALARRLGRLAQHLTTEADIDEEALTQQLDQLELAVSRSPSRSRELPQSTTPAYSPVRTPHRQSPARLEPQRSFLGTIPVLGSTTPAHSPARTPQYSSPVRAPEQLRSKPGTPAALSPAKIPEFERSTTPAYSPARPIQIHTPAQIHLQHQQLLQYRPPRLGVRSQSDLAGMIPTSSPAPPLHQSRYSDLSASMLARLSEINAAEFNEQTYEEPPPKKGMSEKQAEKVIIEAAKLNNELSTVVENLKARLEESDVSLQPSLLSRKTQLTILQLVAHSLPPHRTRRKGSSENHLPAEPHFLLVRPPSLTQPRPRHANSNRNREEELQENDDELQHLRICLKAVEIQLPPHPDNEIQRCITTFKADYRALKQKRLSRSSIASYSSLDNSRS